MILPSRSTKGSAGYDIYTPFDILAEPGEIIKIPTGIKCMIDNCWVLEIVPRSSLGFKYGMRLNNTVGVIDSDYYNNENNEGHIWIKFKNDGNKMMKLKEGDRICQGLFIPFGITYDDNVDTERTGGFGSTGN